jgi:hypothetical protein
VYNFHKKIKSNNLKTNKFKHLSQSKYNNQNKLKKYQIYIHNKQLCNLKSKIDKNKSVIKLIKLFVLLHNLLNLQI